jgi:hypothetical protein
MTDVKLPESIHTLTESLQLVELSWLGVPIQVPRFSVYAVIPDPVFDDIIERKGRIVGIMRMGRYLVPVLDPFKSDMKSPPKYVVIVSLMKKNNFGLFAYPADHVEYNLRIPIEHSSVKTLVRDFL